MKILEKIRASFIDIKFLYFYLTFIFITFIYFTFSIKIHSWECYWYAAGIEKLFDVTSIYNFFHGVRHSDINFNIYHPNHPLLHFISFIIYQIFIYFNISIRSLTIIQFINLLFGLLSLLITYKIIFYYTKSDKFSRLLTLLFAFTDICWYYSMSGEVYICPYSMILLTFYILLLIKDALENNKKITYLLIYAASAFGLAIAFHLMVVPFGLVILCYFIMLKKNHPEVKLFNNLFLMGSVIIFFITIFYIILPIILFDIKTLDLFLEALFLPNPGTANNINYSAEFASMSDFFISFIFLIVFKINSFFNSIIRTNNVLVIIYKFTLMITFLWSIFHYLKDKKKEYLVRILFIWLFVFFLTIAIFVVQEADDYWLPLLFPFILTTFLNLKSVLSKKILHSLLFIIISINFYFNFTFDIYPKHKASEADYCLLSQIKEKINKYNNFIFVYKRDNDENFFDEIWYVNYFLKIKNIIIISNDEKLKVVKDNSIIKIDQNIQHKQFTFSDKLVIVSRRNLQNKFLINELTKYNFKIKEEMFYKIEDTKFEKLAGYPYGYIPVAHFKNTIIVQYLSLQRSSD